jgi:hypothetical protein
VYSEITAQKEGDMTDAGIVDLALHNKVNLRGALLIAQSSNEIKNSIFSKLLRHIEKRLLQLVQQKGSDWELVLDWRKGRWSNKPEAKWLLILLRRTHWPAMVGVGIQAERDGPDRIIIGILAPTEAGFTNDPQSVSYYGDRRNFISDEARLALKKAVNLNKPFSDWWISQEDVNDVEGHNLSRWEDIDTVIRLYEENDAICECIVIRISALADAADKALGSNW